jgi:carbon storage regulator
MLVLSRKLQEAIIIGGHVKVVVLGIQGRCVKLGIEAPATVTVHRLEVQQRVSRETSSRSSNETSVALDS